MREVEPGHSYDPPEEELLPPEEELLPEEECENMVQDFEDWFDKEMDLSEFAESGETEWNAVFRSHMEVRLAMLTKYLESENMILPPEHLKHQISALKQALLIEKTSVYIPLLTGEEIPPLGGGTRIRSIINLGLKAFYIPEKPNMYREYLDSAMKTQLEKWHRGKNKPEKDILIRALDKAKEIKKEIDDKKEQRTYPGEEAVNELLDSIDLNPLL
jgi:hypothetical protein